MFVIKNKIKGEKSIIALLFISLICSSFSYADDNNVVIKSFAKTNDDTGVIIRDDGNKNYSVVYFPEDKEALDVTFSGIKFGTATEETIEASKNYCTPSFSSCQASFSLNSVYDSISVKTKTKMGLEKEIVKEKMLEFKPFISKNVLMLKNIQDDEMIISEILSENKSITTPDRSFPIVLKKDELFELKIEAKDGDKAEDYAIKVKYKAHGKSLTGKIIIAKQYDEVLSKCLAAGILNADTCTAYYNMLNYNKSIVDDDSNIDKRNEVYKNILEQKNISVDVLLAIVKSENASVDTLKLVINHKQANASVLERVICHKNTNETVLDAVIENTNETNQKWFLLLIKDGEWEAVNKVLKKPGLKLVAQKENGRTALALAIGYNEGKGDIKTISNLINYEFGYEEERLDLAALECVLYKLVIDTRDHDLQRESYLKTILNVFKKSYKYKNILLRIRSFGDKEGKMIKAAWKSNTGDSI